MGTEGNTKAKPGRRSKRRILVWVLAIVVVLVVLVVFLVPGFVSSEKGRKIILAKINSSIDGEVDFAGLSMSWWRGIKVTDFSFNDGAGHTLIEAKQIITKPHYGSILTGGLSFGETRVDEPKVEINLEGQQAERSEDLPGEVLDSKKYKAIAFPIRKIDLVVNDGSLKVTGRGGETAEVAGINSKLTILPLSISSGKLGFAKAEYMGLHFGPTEVDVQIQDGRLRIAPFSSTVNNGQFNFAGEADFKESPTLFKTMGPIQMIKNVQINDETARRFLMYLNPIFANAISVSGAANFNCERFVIPLSGGGQDDIEVIGTVSIDQLRLEASDLLGQILSTVGVSVRGQNITISPTRFVLQGGFLRYDDMQMVVGDNPVNFAGAIGLDKSLNMRVTLPYTTRGKTVRVGEKDVGARRISLPLKGTIDKPELDPGKLFEEQLESQLRELLEEELKGELGERLKEELKGELGEKLLDELEGLFKK